MRVVIQRVRRASVSVDGQVVGAIGAGLVILVGVREGDAEAQAAWLAQKVAHLRIFEDENGKMNRSLLEMGGSALVVSQFTLYGDAQHGRRPSFSEAARPEVAEPLIARFAELLRAEGVRVETGVFQAMMLVEIHNDGPVTLIIDR
ncbi:MAG: D-tyrosyl-tRNA(Tyr) deacylase [Chloroflexi bacterium]|nr:D-tyrosyl-tRNA(Tyr) deacylase [Chloroflexota bacterium]